MLAAPSPAPVCAYACEVGDVSLMSAIEHASVVTQSDFCAPVRLSGVQASGFSLWVFTRGGSRGSAADQPPHTAPGSRPACRGLGQVAVVRQLDSRAPPGRAARSTQNSRIGGAFLVPAATGNRLPHRGNPDRKPTGGTGHGAGT
jgi:hypothetical protein